MTDPSRAVSVAASPGAGGGGVPAGDSATGRAIRLSVLGALYSVSNIGFAFFFLTLGTILLGSGASLTMVAFVELLGTVYFGRVLVAPLVDRFGSVRFGHYRSWLVVTQLALIATLAGSSAIDPIGDPRALFVLLVLVLVISMFHDVALNGMAIRMLRPTDHGIANGIQVASGSASMLIGSSGALWLYTQTGWTATLLTLAMLFALPLGVLAGLTEPASAGERRTVKVHSELSGFFGSRERTMWALVVIPVFGAGVWMATASVPAMLLSAGWPMDRIAVVQAVASSFQMAAALVAGFAITRWGAAGPAVVVGLFGCLSVAGLLPAAAGNADPLPTTAVLIAVYIGYGVILTIVSAVSMRRARPESASTDFSIPMSVEGIFVSLIGSLGLGLADAVGFPWLIGTAVCFAGAAAAVAPRWIHRYGRASRLPAT